MAHYNVQSAEVTAIGALQPLLAPIAQRGINLILAAMTAQFVMELEIQYIRMLQATALYVLIIVSNAINQYAIIANKGIFSLKTRPSALRAAAYCVINQKDMAIQNARLTSMDAQTTLINNMTPVWAIKSQPQFVSQNLIHQAANSSTIPSVALPKPRHILLHHLLNMKYQPEFNSSYPLRFPQQFPFPMVLKVRY